MKLRPVNDKIVVKPIEKDGNEDVTESGIILPDSVQGGKLIEGEVIAVGEGMYSANGVQIPVVVKVGDIILYNKHAQVQDYKLNDVRQLIADNSISDYSELYRLLYDEVETYGKGKVAECILNIAEAQFQDVNVVDKEINFMSLIIRLTRILK